MEKVHSVDEYIDNHSSYREALELLRDIVLSTNLTETIKWNAPTYTLNGKNVLSIAAFKNHFCIWFYNGATLKDKYNLLVNVQEGKTKALRQMRFDSLEAINKVQVLAYIREAFLNEELGNIVKTKRVKKELLIPNEFQLAFDSSSELNSSFQALTPYKQREYCEHISSAKREATKQSRLEKIKPLILKGVGLHDKYKNC
ncbi:hypothetical protein F6U93_11700 [Tamlana haliotis]|uniref:YdhG-like domain-containing protein n=1 Tax=Pseudotamlana haliotis TaxID=2614804 RepID=A0A6N6M9A3_9FLAO|nr:YdeI/OmpD-associated family protein [Tamlana haliotis]KAB1067079.1 hypothetical protein F6U93_11700 [Tamlana haliotis]